MYTNNLVVNKNEKKKIPQNENSYFVIKKSNILKHSINIEINPFEQVDLINLYIIIKSFASNIIYIPRNMLIVIKNVNEKEIIAKNINIDEFKNIKFYAFYKWFLDELQENWKYIKTSCQYIFIITFPIDVFNRELLEFLEPQYPWKEEIVIEFNKIIEIDKKNEETINNQAKEIIKLKKEIEELKKSRL